MAKVARLTNGTYNWVFRSENGQVKMNVTDRYKVTEKEEFTLEKGRTVYKTLKQCVPNIKVGFTPLERELKSHFDGVARCGRVCPIALTSSK